jgi:hypothetical protein
MLIEVNQSISLVHFNTPLSHSHSIILSQIVITYSIVLDLFSQQNKTKPIDIEWNVFSLVEFAHLYKFIRSMRDSFDKCDIHRTGFFSHSFSQQLFPSTFLAKNDISIIRTT